MFEDVQVVEHIADTSWRAQLRRDLAVLAAWRRRETTLDELGPAAARLVDSRHRSELGSVLEAIGQDRIAEHAGLAYAAGYLSLIAGDQGVASERFASAQAALDPSWRRLAARIAFELGFAHLAGSRPVTADTLLAWAEGLYADGMANADLLHLRAIAAEHMGDHAGARDLYRTVLQTSAESLTPMTRALAMTNLAASMNHVDPEESLALTRLAGSLVDAEDLDPRARAAVSNIESYALICLARLREARTAASRALEEARQFGHPRVGLYALFNTAVIDELEGAPTRARETLGRVRAESAAGRFADLEGWAILRLAWLDARDGDAARARQRLDHGAPQLGSMRYAEALKTMSGLINFGLDRLASARMDLESALRSARQRGDLIDQLALLLWLGRTEGRVGRAAAARRAVASGLELARVHRLRISPNWWSAELVRAARDQGVDPTTAAQLVVPADHKAQSRITRTVRISREGRVTVEGAPLQPEAWRVGHTGSRVLQRLFHRLAAAFPSAVTRDDLAEHLWPDSDGDRAIRNLYSATVDLRRLLADVPGVAVVVEEGGYSLDLGPNVEIT